MLISLGCAEREGRIEVGLEAPHRIQLDLALTAPRRMALSRLSR
jgi:hypothetical protein